MYHHHRHFSRHILFCFPRQLVFFQRTRRKAKADRNLKHFKGNLNKTTLNSDYDALANQYLSVSLHLQGDDQQEAEGDCGAGAELRQLQPAAAQGAARRAQQLRGALPEQRKTVSERPLQTLKDPLLYSSPKLKSIVICVAK